MMSAKTPDKTSQGEPLSIIVAGAGLAGLAAAISCALGGHKIIVLEGAKELAEVMPRDCIYILADILTGWGRTPDHAKRVEAAEVLESPRVNMDGCGRTDYLDCSPLLQ